MHRKRMKSYVLASVLTLAGCGGGVATDRTFPVFFDNDSVTMDEPAQDIVVRASNVARQYPLAAVTVEGFTDNPRTRTDGAHISTERADVVTASLVAHGVNESRLKRSDNTMAPDGEAGVSNRRVNIAIEVPIGTP